MYYLCIKDIHVLFVYKIVEFMNDQHNIIYTSAAKWRECGEIIHSLNTCYMSRDNEETLFVNHINYDQVISYASRTLVIVVQQ